MRHLLRYALRAGASLVASAALLAVSGPAGRVLAATTATPPPASTCTLTNGGLSPNPARACDLYATTGTLTLPDSTTVPIWGYSDSPTGSAQLPGPVIVANQGETLSITLHNNLAEATSLAIPGFSLPLDTTGVAVGGITKTYTLTLSAPGTFVYGPGPLTDGALQSAMGLSGVLIVRPTGAPTHAYNAATAFANEGLLVFSEIDPALNTSADPHQFNLGTLKPRYWLINGAAYPNTGEVAVTAGTSALLRLVNTGSMLHTVGLLGVSQQVIATSGHLLKYPYTAIAETVPAGSSLDSLVSVPASASNGTRYALYDSGMHVDNNGQSFGGMLTFLNVSSSTTAADTAGPLTSSVTVTPGSPNGTGVASLSALVSDQSTGGSTIKAARFFVDSTSGAGTAMTGSFGGATATVSASFNTATLGLASGTHTVYIQGQDAANNWGPLTSATFMIDTVGPVVSSVVLTPPLLSSGSVIIRASASDATTGNANVTAAQYQIDGGTWIDMGAPSVTGPSVSFQVTISAPTTEGAHTIRVQAQDAFGNWSPTPGTTALKIDRTAPIASAVVISPNPNNGTLSVGGVLGTNGGNLPSFRVDAHLADPLSAGVSSAVVNAEAFIDAIGADGSGYLMQPTDGAFSSTSENGYVFIPLSVLTNLASGPHIIYVHGQDAAGNWYHAAAASWAQSTLVLDRTAPTIGPLTLTPPAANNTAVAVGTAATDVATGNSNIAGGEFFIDTVGAVGTGTAMTASAAAPAAMISGSIPATTVAALTAGNHTVYVRAEDAAGNWSSTASITLLIDRTAPTFTSITLNPNSILATTATVNMTVNGASDGAGGSGVVGGEYWFGNTNITAGTGTAFTGLTNVPITTGSLAAGSYTVRIRIRDAAGNWSTGANGVRTATLTVTASVADAIFSDGFESGNTSAWSSRSTNTTTRLNVTTGAALAGTDGLQAQGDNANYVQYNFGTGANPATTTYDARFYFNPNSNAASTTGQDILRAQATGGSFNNPLFHVRYSRNGTQPRVQIQVGNTTNANWVSITNNAKNTIEVVWQSGTSLQLYVNGTLAQTITTANTGSVTAVRLGSVTAGPSNTLMYFDAFASKRSVSPLIGQ